MPTPVSRTANPFPTDGVTRDARGVAHYDRLPANLVAMLSAHVERTPDVEAVAELDGERLTYRQLWDRAARVAGGLRAAGVGRGDRVALRYPAGVDWVLAFWGTVMAGGVAVAVNTRFAAPEVEFVLGDAGVTVDLAPGTPLPDGAPSVVDDLTHDDLAGLFYTSGTTGRPKGVPTTHGAFLSNCESMTRCTSIDPGIGAGLRTLISVPLFHVTGCNSQLLTAAYLGGTSVIMPALDPPRLAATLGAERISFVVTVPAVYALLLQRGLLADVDLSTVRWVAYGGAPIAASLVGEIKAAFPAAKVYNGFGMTETASIMTVLPDADAQTHADSVGYAVPVDDLAVDAPDASGAGELLVRGPNVLAEYWNRPDETPFTDEGWLRTGDIVRVDDAGRVRIVDRSKDIIIRGGENVSSVEVESALADAPGVLDAAVIAVPDEVMGEKVGAVLVTADGSVDADGVLAHCRERLADYKVPQYLIGQSEPLPRNAGGKLLKARLREQVRWGDAC